MPIHYHGDRKRLDRTLCGETARRADLTWNRLQVTCQACAAKFDASIQRLRQDLDWFKKAE